MVFVEHLRKLHWNCQPRPEVLWLDSSDSPSFHALLLDASRRIPGYVHVLDERLRVADPLPMLSGLDGWTIADTKEYHTKRDIQVSLLYQRIRNELTAKHGWDPNHWVLLLESDVVAPPDTFDRLHRVISRTPLCGAISGRICYGGRPLGHLGGPSALVRPMVWRMPSGRERGPFDPEPQGPEVLWHAQPPDGFEGAEVVDAVPMGCCLLRLSTLASVPIRTTWPPAMGYGFDQLLCRDLTEELGLYPMVEWGTHCGHIKCDPDGNLVTVWDSRVPV